MATSRIVPPTLKTIALGGDGATITVKERLNTGETRALMREDPESKTGLEKSVVLVAAYLVDWTITDDRGGIVPIRGLARADLEATFDALDLEAFIEIANAIGAHVRTQVEARAAEKKIPNGDPV